MTKKIINKNSKNQLLTKNTKQKKVANLDTILAKSLGLGVVSISLGMFLPELAFADINYVAMGKATAKPLVTFMNYIWPLVVCAGGACGYMAGQGDFAQRWKPTAFGLLGGGGLMTALEFGTKSYLN